MSRVGRGLRFRVLPGDFAVCRLDKEEPVPDWAARGNFFSITRTEEELSLLCLQAQVPPGIKTEGGWRRLKIEGPLDFSMTGVLASITAPLAREGISVLAISTYDTDYLLVKKEKMEAAVEALIKVGHEQL
jgi:hypothetical protein